MSINHAILGILSYKSMTGYDLKKVIQDTSFLYWSGNNNQVYKSLSELLDRGLVTHITEHQQGAPTKKIYTVTPEGLTDLKEWVLSPSEPSEVKKPFLIQLAMARQLNTQELNALLDAYEREVKTQLLMESTPAQAPTFLSERTALETTLWGFINENIRRTYETELGWIKDLREAILSTPNENDVIENPN